MSQRRMSSRIGMFFLAMTAAVTFTFAAGPRPDGLTPSVAIVPPSVISLLEAPYFGTKVRFETSPEAAFARARREGKLVLLLHLSGEFRSSETT